MPPVDVPRLIGAVTRRVELRDYRGKPAQVVIAERCYDTDVPDLWDALTSRERLPRWFLPVSGDMRLGGRFQLEGNAGGEITTCDAPTRLGITWEYGGDTSWVEVELQSNEDGGTTLHLEHIAHTPEDFWREYGPGAGGVGWEQALFGLEMYLVGDAAPIAVTEAEAWLATPPGQALIRASSEAWGEASIAAGATPEDARAAAGRTATFYGAGPESEPGG